MLFFPYEVPKFMQGSFSQDFSLHEPAVNPVPINEAQEAGSSLVLDCLRALFGRLLRCQINSTRYRFSPECTLSHRLLLVWVQGSWADLFVFAYRIFQSEVCMFVFISLYFQGAFWSGSLSVVLRNRIEKDLCSFRVSFNWKLYLGFVWERKIRIGVISLSKWSMQMAIVASGI